VRGTEEEEASPVWELVTVLELSSRKTNCDEDTVTALPPADVRDWRLDKTLEKDLFAPATLAPPL
jgi:hypothetical protein